MTGKPSFSFKIGSLSVFFCLCFICFALKTLAQEAIDLKKNAEGRENVPGEIIVNGDTVEYAIDSNEVVAYGNVSVSYKGTLLKCSKLSVNTRTKEAKAEGKVSVEDAKSSVIRGEEIIYNFQDKTGAFSNAKFISSPYFGQARRLKKVSANEFIGVRGYATTCNLDRPHYLLNSQKIRVFPDDKIQMERVALYLGKAPLMYLPHYSHSLKDPLFHMQVMPGKRKDWGAYLLTATRYNLAQNVSGRIYLDYRDRLGIAQGFGTNYSSYNFGRGDFKYYYSRERDNRLPQGTPSEFERYLIRWRHKWDLDLKTNLTAEYYKITDSKRALLGNTYNLLKDYFYREYEKDAQPPSYVLLHRSFDNSSLDLILQKRANRWYDSGYLEKLPEISYSLPSLKIADTFLYFENISYAGNYNKKNTSTSTPAANALNPDTHFNRLDTSNKLSLPFRVLFLNFTPYVQSRQTFYSERLDSKRASLRNIFYTGADLSTKFYRLFEAKTNFLGLDINGLRHIITPSAGYAYNHAPTIPKTNLKQIDSVDSIIMSNALALELSNKLQTKRQGKSVDIVNFRINSNYLFKPGSATQHGSNFSDFLFDLELIPYSWLRADADATFKHSGGRGDPNYNRFYQINYDLNLTLASERSIGFGQRYIRKGGSELTFNAQWRLNPKWKFAFYERYQLREATDIKRGLKQQQYSLSRDLHCWEMDFTYDVNEATGHTVWLIMRLKAFPEMEFNYNQNYHAPKPGSRS